MQIQPYLFFGGNCEEAIGFYKKAVNAEVLMMMRFSESPDPSPPGCEPRTPNDIMHACVRIGKSEVLLSDGIATEKPGFHGFSLALQTENAADVDRYFAALSEGGQVFMPVGKTFFAERFGMLVDRYGVNWMIGYFPKDCD